MLSSRLKELRKKIGLTQEQLAVLLGVERSSVGKYEGKSSVIPSADVLNKMADIFGVTVDYLLGREPKKEPTVSNDGFTSVPFQDIIVNLKQLNADGQAKVREYTDDLVQSGKYPASNMVVVPIAARSGGKHQIVADNDQLDADLAKLVPSHEDL